MLANPRVRKASAPAIDIEKSTNGQDADTGTGPLVAVSTLRPAMDAPMQNVVVGVVLVAAVYIDTLYRKLEILAEVVPPADFTDPDGDNNTDIGDVGAPDLFADGFESF